MNRLLIESELHERARELATVLEAVSTEELTPLLGQPMHDKVISQAADLVTGKLHERLEWTRGEFVATAEQDLSDPSRLTVGAKPLTLWATQVWARAMNPSWHAQSVLEAPEYGGAT
jgi:hypothetical protein